MRRRRQESIYRRTIVQLMLAILLIFMVLAVVYFIVFQWSSRELQKEQLEISVEALASRLAKALDAEHEQLQSESARGDVMFAARASGAMVWLLNHHGEIVLSSALPRHTMDALKPGPSGFYQLPQARLNKAPFGARNRHSFGDFEGLLPKEEQWITASYVLPSATGQYPGEVMMHQAVRPQTLKDFFLARSILWAFVVAFVVAFLIIRYLSHNITRPITALVATASAVYRGDLRARVKLHGDEVDELPVDSAVQEEDELRLLVQTMNTLLSKLERQEQQRQDFMSSLSHDLKTPVTSIKGFVAGMIDGTISHEAYPRVLKILEAETERLHRLIASLFESSLLGQAEALRVSVYGLREHLEGFLSSYRVLLKKKEARLSLRFDNIPDDDPLRVVADKEMMDRVLDNILSNALRFLPTGGVVHLTLSRQGAREKVLLLIEDSGPGIPAEDLPHIFDRFYKVDKARSSEGSGLGLFISRSILQMHGEEIHADRSAQLGGAAISLTWSTPEGLKR